jgi:hypothetical protein
VGQRSGQLARRLTLTGVWSCRTTTSCEGSAAIEDAAPARLALVARRIEESRSRAAGRSLDADLSAVPSCCDDSGLGPSRVEMFQRLSDPPLAALAAWCAATPAGGSACSAPPAPGPAGGCP